MLWQTPAAGPRSAPRAGAWLLLGFGLLAQHGYADMGPLTVHPTNRRYFADGDGKAVYLTGSHTWNNTQDTGYDGSVVTFNYASYLDTLVSLNHNFIRLWVDEKSSYSRMSAPVLFTQVSVKGDGRPTYDLSKVNPAYIQRLRQRIADAQARGIYVSVMLFQYYSSVSGSYHWHPFHRDNNINGVNGDLNGDGDGYETHTIGNANAVRAWEGYVRQVVTAINEFDNVIIEIGNELRPELKDFQYHFINFVRSVESGLPKKHLVSMHSDGGAPPDDLANLLNSSADVISPGLDNNTNPYQNNPPPSNGSKIIMNDTDHLWGNGGDRFWAWKSFTRGLHVIFMDSFHDRGDRAYSREPWNTPTDIGLRRALGHTNSFAKRMDMARMAPRGDLSSTGYALADPGQKYLVYNPGSGGFSVNLAAGNYSFEWFNPASGAAAGSGSFSAGAGTRSFTPPFSGDSVLFLSASGAPPPPPPPPPNLACDKVGSDSFEACYFDNMDLTALSALKNVGASLNQAFGLGSPDPAIGPDTFSASYRGTFSFEAGEYEFTATADDGVRLYVGGQLLIDQWKDQVATAYKARKTMTAGRHELKIEYYENGGEASIALSYVKAAGPPPPPPPPPPPALSCGAAGTDRFTACYFDNSDLTGLAAVKDIGPALDLDFGLGSPDPAVGPDTFSASFRGTFNFDAADYEFIATADDGVRVYVDGAALIDEWKVQAAATYSAARAMTAGRHEVRVDYFENLGSALVKLAVAKKAGTAVTDVNGDGRTDISDVQLAVNQSLGLSSCGSGDVNGDGQCTILDVQRVANAALGT